MTDQSDYRLYLKTEFDGIHSAIEKLSGTVDKLVETTNDIKVQTTKTNNKVIHLEEDLTDLENEVEKDMEWAHNIVDNRTTTSCPNLKAISDSAKKIETLEDGLKDVNFFVRHPKLFLGVLVVLVILSIASIIQSGLFQIGSSKATDQIIEATK
jgi:predicted RNase H-like nuclease (RuvC/YqgF family)